MPNSEDIFELSEYRKNEIARNERATMAMLISAQKNAEECHREQNSQSPCG